MRIPMKIGLEQKENNCYDGFGLANPGGQVWQRVAHTGTQR